MTEDPASMDPLLFWTRAEGVGRGINGVVLFDLREGLPSATALPAFS